MRYTVLLVAGARPNFMKVAPIIAALNAQGDVFKAVLVHTGQHYDDKLSAVFFGELGIPRPDVNLEVGSGSHAQQTAAVMAAFEPVLLQHHPDLIVVVGDVNSTIACALVAAKLGVAVAHVEAGLRSYDRDMPEEINRVLTDQISDLLFTTEPSAAGNLEKEGISGTRVHFVGNVMIDTLLTHRARAAALRVPASLGLDVRGYGLMTLHRPSNVDNPVDFERLLSTIGEVSRDVPLVFPVHPRTRPRVLQSPIASAMIAERRLRLLEPLGYLEFIGLLEGSRVVLTDSGGIQEETTILGVPCLTLRENTERPVTISHGTNQLVGTSPDRIVSAWRNLAALKQGPPTSPPLWDGQASQRIVGVLKQFLEGRREER